MPKFLFNPITDELDYVQNNLDDLDTKNHADLDLLGAPADDHEQYALLAGRNGGQILVGGTLTTQNLRLVDNAVDGNFITLTQTGLVPGVTASLDLGTSSLFFRTLYLQYDNQPVITMAHAGIVGSHTDYTIDTGGGDLYGGILLFQFHPAFQSQGSENRFIIDYGVVDVLAAQHAYVFRSTGNAAIVGTLQVETLFGGILGDGNLGIRFSSSGYFNYRNVINSNMAFGGNEIVAGTDPQGSGFGGQNMANKNFQIQMDGNTAYMVNNLTGWNGFYGGVADMSPSNADYGIVTIPGTPRTRLSGGENTRSSAIIYPPTVDMNGNNLNYAANLTIFGVPTTGAAGNAGILMASASTILFGFGFGGVGPQFVGGFLFGEDRLITGAQTVDMPLAFELIPNGTSEKVRVSLYNNPNLIFSPTYARLDIDVNAAVCNIILRQSGAITPITIMNIGGDATSALATINFLLANVAIAYINNTGIVIPSDSDGLFLGAGIDASLIYDGTDLQVDASLQNPSDIKVTCGANKTIEIVNTVYDDLKVPIFATGTAVNSPTLGAFLGAGSLQIFRFTGTGVQVNEVFFVAQLDHRYKEGTDIIPHVHWTPTDANAGNVVWQLEYSWANIDTTYPASTIITVTDATATIAWRHQVAPFAAINGTGKNISSMLVCRLFRDPAHGSDNYGFDAALKEIDFHFEINTMGSRQEFVK